MFIIVMISRGIGGIEIHCLDRNVWNICWLLKRATKHVVYVNAPQTCPTLAVGEINVN